MRIYIICPVRRATEEQKQRINLYVAMLEIDGHKVCLPYRDVPQTTPEGIVRKERAEISMCDEVHVFWDNDSVGSHVDLGMALGLNKRTVLIEVLNPGPEHSYQAIIGKL
jgi:hypothetical protein